MLETKPRNDTNCPKGDISYYHLQVHNNLDKLHVERAEIKGHSKVKIVGEKGDYYACDIEIESPQNKPNNPYCRMLFHILIILLQKVSYRHVRIECNLLIDFQWKGVLVVLCIGLIIEGFDRHKQCKQTRQNQQYYL